jgi:hypothetical protein
VQQPALDANRAFGRAIAILASRWRSMAAIALATAAPVFALWACFTWGYVEASSGDPGAEMAIAAVAWLTSWIAAPVGLGALIAATDDALDGQPSPSKSGVVLRRFLPLFGTTTALTIAVALGSVALLVPGVCLAVVFYAALPVAALENIGTIGALRRAWRLGRGQRRALFGIAVRGLIMILWPFGILLFGLRALVSWATGTSAEAAVAVASPTLLFGLLYAGLLLQSVFATVAYRELCPNRRPG